MCISVRHDDHKRTLAGLSPRHFAECARGVAVTTPNAHSAGARWEFAAGDVRHGSTRRVAFAVGEGAMAVGLAEHRLDELLAG